jgi:hypothetical protein
MQRPGNFQVKIDAREHALIEAASRNADKAQAVANEAAQRVNDLYLMLKIRYDIPVEGIAGQLNISPDHILTFTPQGLQLAPIAEARPAPAPEPEPEKPQEPTPEQAPTEADPDPIDLYDIATGAAS